MYVHLVSWWSRSDVLGYARERQVGRDFDVAGDSSERLDVGRVYVAVWSASLPQFWFSFCPTLRGDVLATRFLFVRLLYYIHTVIPTPLHACLIPSC
jgi:hypothetical protein